MIFIGTEEADLLSGERRRRQIPSLIAAIGSQKKAPRGNRPTLPRWQPAMVVVNIPELGGLSIPVPVTADGEFLGNLTAAMT